LIGEEDNVNKFIAQNPLRCVQSSIASLNLTIDTLSVSIKL